MPKVKKAENQKKSTSSIARLIAVIIGMNIFWFFILISTLYLLTSLLNPIFGNYTKFVVLSLIALPIGAISGAITKGSKKYGLAAGLFSTISLLFIGVATSLIYLPGGYRYVESIIKVSPYLVAIGIIGILGGLLGNYLSRKGLVKKVTIAVIICFIVIIAAYYLVSSYTNWYQNRQAIIHSSIWTSGNSIFESGFGNFNYNQCLEHNQTIYCLISNPATSGIESIFGKINQSGEIAWKQTTNISKGTSANCVTNGNYIYCIHTGDYARINSTGIGNWTSFTSYPIKGSICVINLDYMYCLSSVTFGPEGYQAYYSTANYSKISSNGTVNNWNNTTLFPYGSLYACISYSNYIYCLTNSGEVGYAALTSKGIGNWSRTTSYPDGLLGSCFIANSYLVCIDKSGNLYYSNMTNSGLGIWSYSSLYPNGIILPSCISNNVSVFCIGGEEFPKCNGDGELCLSDVPATNVYYTKIYNLTHTGYKGPSVTTSTSSVSTSTSSVPTTTTIEYQNEIMQTNGDCDFYVPLGGEQAYPINATSDGILKYLGVDIAFPASFNIALGFSKMVFAIYLDKNNQPYELLGYTNPVSIVNPGWIYAPLLQNVSITKGVKYYIAFQINTSGGEAPIICSFDPTPSGWQSNQSTFGHFDNQFVVSKPLSDGSLNLRMIYLPINTTNKNQFTSITTTSTSTSSTSTTIPYTIIHSNVEVLLKNYTLDIPKLKPINTTSRLYEYGLGIYHTANSSYSFSFNAPYPGYLVFNVTSTLPNNIRNPNGCNLPIYISQEKLDIVNGPIYFDGFNFYNTTEETLCPLQGTTYYIPVKNGTTYMVIYNQNTSYNVGLAFNLKYVGYSPTSSTNSNAEVLFDDYTINIRKLAIINNTTSSYYPPSYQLINSTYVYQFNAPYPGYLVLNASSTLPNVENSSPNWQIGYSQQKPNILNSPFALYDDIFNDFNSTVEGLGALQGTTYYIPVKNGTTYMVISNTNTLDNISIRLNLKYLDST
jgi:hypothetical protein